MTGDPYRYQSNVALFATSRAAEFLARFGSAVVGREAETTYALAMLLGSRMPLTDAPPFGVSEVTLALEQAAIAGASEMANWLAAFPAAANPERLHCITYWRGVFLSISSQEDGGGPEGVGRGKWRSLRAAGEGRPQDAPQPDPLAGVAQAYRERAVPLVDLSAAVENWRDGPFSDFDLVLAREFEWPVAEGLMWSAWIDAIEFAQTVMLWQMFAPSFDVAERQALVDWKAAQAVANRAAAEDPSMPGLAEAMYPDPPCHPDALILSDA